MFSRRRRSASLSRPTTPVSSSAQTAAAQAFLANRVSNANLSNAAAVAALRSQTSTPVPISEIQTKRMLQRQSSTSSNGSAPGNGRGGPHELRRQNSSGSMTERTFRSPSPNRPGSRSGPDERSAPPVPPVPHYYGNGTSTHRRATSLEPPPARVLSPPPKKQGGRGFSLDRGPKTPASTRRPKSSSGPLPDINELERSDSRNSVNFSYPMTGRPNSPLQKTIQKDITQSHALAASTLAAKNAQEPPKSNGLPAADVSKVQQSLSKVANAPVKKKKKSLASGVVEGSHFSAGGTGGRPMGTAIPSKPAPVIAEIPAARGLPAEPKPPTRQKKTRVVSPVEGDSDSDMSEPAIREKRTLRASGILNKQPSIVREDWEGEQATGEQEVSPVSSPVNDVQGRKEAYAPNTTRQLDEAKAVTQGLPTLITTIPSPSLEMEELMPKMLQPNSDLQTGGRHPSTSPSPSRSRSARFSAHLASELSAEGRHEPPPRSISPAKSALKHHSSSPHTRSPIDGMPGGWRLSSQTPSETSDTTSLASADGLAPGAKKKKSARVSFDSEPGEVGTAAVPEVKSDSPNTSPASRERKGWLGFGKAKSQPLNTIPAEDEMEEVMKPRPALPSFGSVRGKRDGSYAQTMSPVESAPSSANSSLSNMATMDTSVSSDHVIGNILAQDARKKSATPAPESVPAPNPNIPLPPDVTSVEGSGYVSDTESAYSDHGESTADHDAPAIPEKNPSRGFPAQSTLVKSDPVDATPLLLDSHLITTESAHPVEPTPEIQHPATEITPAPEPAVAAEAVPEIAVQPATPNAEIQDTWLVDVPGGFPRSETPEAPRPANASPIFQEVPASTPADLGLTEPTPPEAAIAQDPALPAVGGLAEALRLQSISEGDSDSDGNSSIYSDAAEDAAELEGDGFGSINAIVESPMVPSPTQRIVTPPQSPTAPKGQSGAGSSDWEQAQTHWSTLAGAQRDNVTNVKRVPPPTMEQPPKPKPKTKKKKAASLTGPAPVGLVAGPRVPPASRAERPFSAGLPQPSAMKNSMRTQSLQGIEAPSMRGDGPPRAMKSSMRNRQGAATSTASVPAPQPKGALQKRSIPAVAAPMPNTTATKPLQRTTSNDSDSSSSFRKRRRPMSTDGRYTMRRSMRVEPLADVPLQRSAAPVGRGISSPPESRRPLTSGGQGTMRSTLRTSVDSGTPSLRGNQKSSSAFSGFGKSAAQNKPVLQSKIAMTAPAPSPTTASRFKSRFANDSDDEDNGGVAKKYQSRYVDSSDEEPTNLRPVRGIPRRTDDDDSTDLEDSSADEAPKTRRSQVKIDSDKAIEAQSGNLYGERRHSSGSGRDLSKSTDKLASPSSQKKKNGIFSRFKSKKVKDDNLKVSKPKAESPARRDTPLERSQLELEQARSPPVTPSPASGKLQRRVPSRIMSDSWPLPEKTTDDEGRPSTSDGLGNKSLVTSARPTLPGRQETSNTMRTEGGTPIVGRSGKKKRFPALRKALGLHD